MGAPNIQRTARGSSDQDSYGRFRQSQIECDCFAFVTERQVPKNFAFTLAQIFEVARARPKKSEAFARSRPAW